MAGEEGANARHASQSSQSQQNRMFAPSLTSLGSDAGLEHDPADHDAVV
jgi:hypothetical protein